MTEPLQCTEQVGEAPGYWHWHQCTRRAKWVATKDGEQFPLCGIHVKWYRRRGDAVEPVVADA